MWCDDISGLAVIWNASVGTPESIGAFASRSLLLEIDTWPKPGLVSTVDTGSHADMDAPMLANSARVLRPFFVALVEAGLVGAPMSTLRTIGIAAELAMLKATGGINTHRGAIFGLGLLCSACGILMSGDVGAGGRALGRVVKRRWGPDILSGPVVSLSHGSQAYRQFGSGGARAEAAAGFPHIYNVGLPALRAARKLTHGDEGAARVQACMALIACLEDTNLLHRGGTTGLLRARGAAADFMAAGGVLQTDWKRKAIHMHLNFVAHRLSPGGSADLLAMTVFVDALESTNPRLFSYSLANTSVSAAAGK